MPELVSGVGDRSAFCDAGVVHENVSVAETLAQIAEHAGDAFRIGDVANERDSVVADFIRDLLYLFGSSRSDGDTDARACKGQGDCATNTTAAASNQSCFSHG